MNMSSSSTFGGFGVTVPPVAVTSFTKYVFNNGVDDTSASIILLESMSSVSNGFTTMSNAASGDCWKDKIADVNLELCNSI